MQRSESWKKREEKLKGEEKERVRSRRRRWRRTVRGRQRNLNERSGSDRDLIIELLAPVAADIINVG